jgi:dCMP deaminase
MGRISWDRYFMKIAEDVAERSTCLRHKIGAVIVSPEHHIIVATGYNGNPRGMNHCEDIGCVRDKEDLPSGVKSEVCTAVHAEQNALMHAGMGSWGGTMYCNIQPCNTCAKMIANGGIKRVVYNQAYPDKRGLNLLVELGIEVMCLGEGCDKNGQPEPVKAPKGKKGRKGGA